MKSLFVYGSLMDPKVQKEVIGRITKGESDILLGYKKVTIEIEGITYPILIPNENSSVKGLIIQVSDRELKDIDEFETNAYKRIKVKLQSNKESWVYIKS